MIKIESIKVSNFKTFRDEKIQLGALNIAIGSNASGKSNFVQIFQFLKDIKHHGLENAISIQGGIEYLRNVNLGSKENLSVELTVDQKIGRVLKSESGKPKTLISLQYNELFYTFSLKFYKNKKGFKIVEDRIIQKFEITRLSVKNNNELKTEERLNSGEIDLSIQVNKRMPKVRIKFDDPNSIKFKQEELIPPFISNNELKDKVLLLETPFISLFLNPGFVNTLGNFAIFDFDPKLPKQATPITGKAELEEDGKNLAIVLRDLISNSQQKRKLSNLLADLLPFVKDIDVEKFVDKSFIFKLQESFSREQQYFPASLISDGTVNLIALVVALYFEEESLIIIEEPERNIHPNLISKVVQMMQESSQTKQIIVTTHNPEMVKHAALDDLLLISRDKEGFSHILRPSEMQDVRTFLENEIGIEELYVQNILGLGQ